MSSKQYGRLRKAILREGLAELGFVERGNDLLLSSEECVGCFEFQVSRHDSNTFFVNVGVMSKVLHQFSLDGSPRPSDLEKLPTELNCHVRARLETLPGDGDCPSRWQFLGEDSVEALAAELGRQFLERGVPFMRDRLSNEAVLVALKGEETWLVYQGRELERCVHRAVLLHHAGRLEERDTAFTEAREAAGSNTSWVEDRARQLLDPVLPLDALEGLDQTAALNRLREITGQDFGDDLSAWKNWLRHNHPGL